MFRVTRKADYAVRLMAAVAAAGGAVVPSSSVARSQRIPTAFLRRIARELSAAGLLRASRGAHGGLSLGRPAADITALDVLRAIGPVAINDCTGDGPGCVLTASCPGHPLWLRLQEEIESTLGSITVDEVARGQVGAAVLREGSPWAPVPISHNVTTETG